MDNGLQVKNWIESTKAFHITKEKILAMKKGEVENFLCLDRNSCDAYYDTNIQTQGVAKTPREFFRNNLVMKFTYQEGLKGSSFFNYQKENEPEIVFEFHIEYQPDYWYPLQNGELLGDKRFIIPENMKGSWEKIPIQTRIGWRGPMIRINDLDKLPKVFL